MNLLNSINQFYFEMTLSELRLMNSLYKYDNVTYNSILYLDIIAYKENCTVSWLAESLHIAKSAVTSKVNELMKLSLVEKTQSLTDKRVFHLTINPETVKEYKAYDSTISNAVDVITQKYSAKEVEAFCDMFAILCENCSTENLAKEYNRTDTIKENNNG